MAKESLMLDISDLEFFKVVSEAKSLAAAARELKVSAPAVSQRVAVLERRIGLPLFERKDQKSKLTETGVLLASRGRIILSAMHRLTADLEQQRGGYTNPLRVLVPMGPAGWFISQLALGFMRKHPGVKVRITRKEALPADYLNKDDWDVMAYTGKMIEGQKSELIEQVNISSMNIWLVASPAYVAKYGAPVTPEDLHLHPCAKNQLLWDDNMESDQSLIDWQFSNTQGHAVHVALPAQYSSNDIRLLHDWCLCGMGIVARREVSIIEDIMSGTLVRILPDWQLPPAEVMAVCRKQSQYLLEAREFMLDMKLGLIDDIENGWDTYMGG